METDCSRFSLTWKKKMPEILHDGVIWKTDKMHKTDKTQQLPSRALLKTTQPDSRFCENFS